MALAQKCSKCPYATEKDFTVDAENTLVGKFYTGRKYRKKMRVCKMLSLICGEVQSCPLPGLTDEEIEERETAFDEGE